MNKELLANEIQDYINQHINDEVSKIALAKPIFEKVSNTELAGQIAAKKKTFQKLPTWYHTSKIYYPVQLSLEQTSSEITAQYKSNLAIGNTLIDLTAGFGIDSYFFSKKIANVYSCEINEELSEISQYNADLLHAKNIHFITGNGIDFLENSTHHFDTIYIDPARRNQSSKVFRLKDCTPDVTQHLDLFLSKSERIIIKTAPLLDITAGLNELKNVSEIHIVSVKNECKELLWVIDKESSQEIKITCASLNEKEKKFTFPISALQQSTKIASSVPRGYLYEPDVALLKSGAFNFIGEYYVLQKLHQQSQLYFDDEVKSEFSGRIFEIKSILSLNEIKKEKTLVGNVIVRNFPERAENLMKKYKITPSHDYFIIFTQTFLGFIAIKAKIIQHY